MSTYHLTQGGVPLLVSMPHVGTELPAALVPRLDVAALQLVDTDWRINELYNFLEALDVSVIVPRYSRYVVDLNRPPDGSKLYPGKTSSGICPLQSFAGSDLYRPAENPGPAEVQQRLRDYWHPYHSALSAELGRLKSVHGYALLWDAHSIASEVPALFAGSLPDLNFGTADGASCDTTLLAALEQRAAAATEFSWVSNARFKGGAITRLYGNPEQQVHAVQLELSQATYLQPAPPFEICEQRAEKVRPLLRELLDIALGWKPAATGAH